LTPNLVWYRIVNPAAYATEGSNPSNSKSFLTSTSSPGRVGAFEPLSLGAFFKIRDLSFFALRFFLYSLPSFVFVFATLPLPKAKETKEIKAKVATFASLHRIGIVADF
jgi:hypothetical protein